MDDGSNTYNEGVYTMEKAIWTIVITEDDDGSLKATMLHCERGCEEWLLSNAPYSSPAVLFQELLTGLDGSLFTWLSGTSRGQTEDFLSKVG